MGIDAIFDPHNWSAVPFHFWSAWFFVFGCMAGSFLNVCIHRMPRGLSVVSPPSHCPHCKYSIPFYLNVPLVTWLWLRGRCRNCGAPISAHYFIVELVTGLAFLACWLRFGNPDQPFASMLVALVYAMFVAGLIVATFIDFEHFIIPDEITLGGTLVGLVACFLLPTLQDTDSREYALLWSIVGAAVGVGIVYAILRLGKWLFGRHRMKLPTATRIVFAESCVHIGDKDVPYEELFYRDTDAIVLRAETVELVDRGYRDVPVRLSLARLEIGDERFDPTVVPCFEAVSDEIVLPREAMGLGDVKFMGAIGAFLGWQGAVFSLMVSSLVGAVVGCALILVGRREWSSRMPYGPYIALAAVIWVFCGKRFVESLFQ